MNSTTRPHRAPSWLRWIAGAVVLTFILSSGLVPAARADLRPMHVVWQEDFESGTAPGWKLEHYTRGDQCKVVPSQPSTYSTNQCAWVLSGESPQPDNGAGFRAESPTFAQMGVDPREPYGIRFQYMVPDRAAVCWTYALASQHASLVVFDCDILDNTAVVALVDDSTQDFVQLGRIHKGQWHEIDVLIVPNPMRSTADLTIRFDGAVAGTYRDWPAMVTRERLQMVDMPYRISDGSNPALAPGCFGSGLWDDIQLLVQVPPDPPRPTKLDFHLTPNPFNPRTELSFVLPNRETARVVVYDVAGRLVRSLFDGHLDAGLQSIVWDGKDARQADVASGVYLFSVTIGKQTDLVRAVLVR